MYLSFIDFPFLIVIDFFLNLSLDVEGNLGIVCDCKISPHLLHIFSLSPFCENVARFFITQSLTSCPRAGTILLYIT